MLNCYQFRELISEYLDGEISYSKRKLFEEHKQSCQHCNLLFNSVSVVVKDLHHLPEVSVSENFYLNLRNRIIEERERINRKFKKRKFGLSSIPIPIYGLATAVVVIVITFIVMKMQGNTETYNVPPYVKQQMLNKGASNRPLKPHDRSNQQVVPIDGDEYNGDDNQYIQIDTAQMYLNERQQNFDKKVRSIQYSK